MSYSPYDDQAAVNQIDEQQKIHTHMQHHIDFFPFLLTKEKRILFWIAIIFMITSAVFSLVVDFVLLSSLGSIASLYGLL